MKANTNLRPWQGGKGTPMLKVVEKSPVDDSEREVSALDRLARDGAQRMLEEALEAEVDESIERFRGMRDGGGRALVVRNGRARARTVVVGAGVLDVRAPRVNDKRVVEGERQKFTSEILPPSIGSTCVQPIRSSRPSRRSSCVNA